MLRRVSIFAVGFSVILGACGQEPDGLAEREHGHAQRHEDGQVPQADLPVEQQILTPGISQIPARFVGDWDTPESQCDPRSESRLSITGGEIIYYESVGEVREVRSAQGQGVALTLSMSGEGQVWQRRETFTLADGDDSLIDRDETVRKRCP